MITNGTVKARCFYCDRLMEYGEALIERRTGYVKCAECAEYDKEQGR